MSNTIYNEFLSQLAMQTVNLVSDTIKVILMDPAYVADPDAHMFLADIQASELPTGVGGYTAGGKTITNVAITKQDLANNVKITGDDVTWAASSLVSRYAVLYKDTLAAATSPLILCFDFGSNKTSVNGDFTIQWSEDGIFTISQAV